MKIPKRNKDNEPKKRAKKSMGGMFGMRKLNRGGGGGMFGASRKKSSEEEEEMTMFRKQVKSFNTQKKKKGRKLRQMNFLGGKIFGNPSYDNHIFITEYFTFR